MRQRIALDFSRVAWGTPSRKITAAEHAMIDRYIDEIGATIVARGVSGEALGKPARHAFGDGPPEKLYNRWQGRRADYSRLAREGKSAPQIARLLGVTLKTVKGKIKRLGLKVKI